MVELAALLAALFDGAEPLLDPGELSTLHAQPEQRILEQVRVGGLQSLARQPDRGPQFLDRRAAAGAGPQHTQHVRGGRLRVDTGIALTS